MEENKTIAQDERDYTPHEVAPITLEDVLKVADSSYRKYELIDWHGLELIVRRTISYDEMNTFVDVVASACFNTETGEYEPQNRDFMYKYGEILFYTNVELPRETAEAYDIVYTLDLNSIIEGYIDVYQLADIQSAISEAIDYRLEQNIDSIKAELRKFSNAFVTLGDTMSSIDPEEIKKAVSAIAEHGKLDEGAVVRALFPQKADDVSGEANS